MNVHILYVMELKKAKKKSACLSVCPSVSLSVRPVRTHNNFRRS